MVGAEFTNNRAKLGGPKCRQLGVCFDLNSTNVGIPGALLWSGVLPQSLICLFKLPEDPSGWYLSHVICQVPSAFLWRPAPFNGQEENCFLAAVPDLENLTVFVKRFLEGISTHVGRG